MTPLSTRMKRPFDVIGAIGGLMFFAPVMAAIAAAILLTDGRPLLFRQTRLGRGRRPFTILKFRTMRNQEVTAIGGVLPPTPPRRVAQPVHAPRGGTRPPRPRAPLAPPLPR